MSVRSFTLLLVALLGLFAAPVAEARVYDAGTGRWLTRDPLGMVDGPNVYGYARARPVVMQDPMGLAVCASGQAATHLCQPAGVLPPTWPFPAPNCAGYSFSCDWSIGLPPAGEFPPSVPAEISVGCSEQEALRILLKYGYDIAIRVKDCRRYAHNSQAGCAPGVQQNAVRHCTLACCLYQTLGNPIIAEDILLAHECCKYQCGPFDPFDYLNDTYWNLQGRRCAVAVISGSYIGCRSCCPACTE